MANKDETIARMLEVLNPKRRRNTSWFRSEMNSPETPMKRRLSNSFTETPEKIPRNETSLDVSWISSPREARRIRNDLLEARIQITDLEHRIQRTHGDHKELQIKLDNKNRALQLQHNQDTKKKEQLENKMRSIVKREREAKEKLDEAVDDCRLMKLDYERRIEELEFSINEIQSQLDVYEQVENQQVSMVQSDNNELTHALEMAEREAQYFKDLNDDLKSRLARLSKQSSDLEIKEQMLQTANYKIKSLECTIESYGEWQVHSKLQQEKIINYPQLEKEVLRLREEARNLRDAVQNKLILEEQVHDLTTRLEYHREQEKKLSALQGMNVQLERTVEEWCAVAAAMVDGSCSTPSRLKLVVDRLQQREVTLTSEKISLDSRVTHLEQEMKTVKLENEKLQKLNADSKINLQQHQTLVHRLRKKLQLVSRERDSYRAQLDSYERDLTMFPLAGSTQGASQHERIENLEHCLAGYRDMVAGLEAQLQDAQPQPQLPVHSEQLARLQMDVERATNENTRLTARCDELELRLEQELVGRDTVQASQVLHLKLNPAAQLTADMEKDTARLCEENDRLKRKIRQMEEGLESSRLSESVCSSREMLALREEKQALELKMQRVKDYFKRSSSEFREACYMLLGYKIDRMSSTVYRLSNMYSEKPDDQLQFKLNGEGGLHLLETPFSGTLEELIELHLRQQDSVPAFLSAITIELFNRTTMAVASASPSSSDNT